MIAKNIGDLNSDNNKISKENALTQSGTMINGRGDKPNLHDILTGSNKDGSAATAYCNNWASNGAGTAIIGHHDKKGSSSCLSWNSAHESFGCATLELKKIGGGLFYCLAKD